MLLGVVDLGSLEFVAGVDVDGFPGGVEVECAEAFAVAVAGLFYAAEGQVDFGADGGGVDVGDAGFEVAHGGEGAVDVFGIEGGGEAVVDGVGDLDGFFKGREFEQGDDGAEDFFAGDAHAGELHCRRRSARRSAVGVEAVGEGLRRR